MNRWINQSRNQSSHEFMNEWTINQRINETMNQWIGKPLNQTIEPTNPWISEFLPTSPSQINARTRRNTDRSRNTKTGFRAWECFHQWNHILPNCYTSKLLDDWWLTWWYDWHDGVNVNHDHRAYLGSFLAKLPLMMFLIFTPVWKPKPEENVCFSMIVLGIPTSQIVERLKLCTG